MSTNHPFIAALVNLREDDREISTRADSFLRGISEAYAQAKARMPNLAVAARYGATNFEQYDKVAAIFGNIPVDGSSPDLYLATSWPSLKVLQQLVTTTPIVFTGLLDVSANPGTNLPGASPPKYPANAYGVLSYGANLCTDWVQLLTALMPVRRIGVLYDIKRTPTTRSTGAPAETVFTRIQAAANALPSAINVVQAFDLSEGDCGLGNVRDFVNQSDTQAGLIVATSTLAASNRESIFDLANGLKVPVVYPDRLYATYGSNTRHGGLVSRGPRVAELYRKAGEYAAVLLQNGTPSPQVDITQTTSSAAFETFINLNAAAILGISESQVYSVLAQWAPYVVIR